MEVEPMSDLELKCYLIAENAHKGQVDKGGRPYILHPLLVSTKVQGEHNRCAALLHDVIEDTDLTEQDLLKMGVPADIVYTVAILTRAKDETYADYIQRVATDGAAVAIKLADLEQNMDLSRLKKITDKDRKRVKERYEPAYQYLKNIQAQKYMEARSGER